MSNYNYGYIKKVFEEAPSLSYAYEIFLDRLKKLNKDETEKNELYINVKKIYEEVEKEREKKEREEKEREEKDNLMKVE